MTLDMLENRCLLMCQYSTIVSVKCVTTQYCAFVWCACTLQVSCISLCAFSKVLEYHRVHDNENWCKIACNLGFIANINIVFTSS